MVGYPPQQVRLGATLGSASDTARKHKKNNCTFSEMAEGMGLGSDLLNLQGIDLARFLLPRCNPTDESCALMQQDLDVP